MKHFKKGRKFGRTSKQRANFLNGLVRSLVENEKIITTLARAKSLRSLAEKIISRAKVKNLASLRYLNVYLGKKTAKKIFEVIAPRYQDRKGGYIRISKTVPRKSDGALMAVVEFVK